MLLIANVFEHHCVPGSLLDAEETLINKIDTAPAPIDALTPALGRHIFVERIKNA